VLNHLTKQNFKMRESSKSIFPTQTNPELSHSETNSKE